MVTETQVPVPAAGGEGDRGSGGLRSRGGRGDGTRRPGLMSRIRLYLREVVAELRKVIRPSRQQLVTYTIVVVVLVSVIVALVSALDYGLTRAVLALFR